MTVNERRRVSPAQEDPAAQAMGDAAPKQDTASATQYKRSRRKRQAADTEAQIARRRALRGCCGAEDSNASTSRPSVSWFSSTIGPCKDGNRPATLGEAIDLAKRLGTDCFSVITVTDLDLVYGPDDEVKP